MKPYLTLILKTLTCVQCKNRCFNILDFIDFYLGVEDLGVGFTRNAPWGNFAEVTVSLKPLFITLSVCSVHSPFHFKPTFTVFSARGWDIPWENNR